MHLHGPKDSPLNKLSSNLYKELTCHEVTDPSVCFNQHASSFGLKEHRHFLNHVIFINIENRLVMMSKILARVLTYELGLPSYGDSKLG